MSSRLEPGRSSDPEPGTPSVPRRPKQRWGYITHSTSRYGSSETELVVYPPDASEQERTWATGVHAFAPVAATVTVLAALAVVLAGVSPAHAFPTMMVVLAVGGAAALLKTMRVRRRSCAVWVGVSPLHPDPDRACARRRLEALADTMHDASDALADGRMSTAEYLDLWQDVFTEAGLLRAQWN
ncbi:DUF6611 family protein [Microbacterium sp. NPDC090007]|uniref:DUF6611 family protein n=1 Tax=Microbacterium sp. NPDC090007 TaxID=3364204 RepID=UPI003826A1AD